MNEPRDIFVPSFPAPLGVPGEQAPGASIVHDAPRRLHPAVRWVWLGSAGVMFFVLLVVGLILEFTALPRDWWLPRGVTALGTALVLSGLAAAYAMMRYGSWSYAVREQDVLIGSGVFWKVRRSIPRARVQHVDITAGPLDRAFGLVEVHLFTAGALGPVASIPGLSPEAAEELRSALVRGGTDGV
jgi:hypothetical protein